MKFLQTVLLLSFFVFSQAQTTPSQQPTNLTISAIKAYKANFSFQGVPNTSGYLVLVSQSPITSTPQNTIFYEVGDIIGNAKVLKADGTTISLMNGLRASTNYYLAVYAYNTQGAGIAYLTTNPLTNNFTTSSSNPGNYYANFNEQSPTMVSDLTNLIYPHIRQSYDLFDENVVEQVLQADTVGGEKVVFCEYSNQPYLYTGAFAPSGGGGWNVSGFSREHIFPRSWMQTNAVSGTFEHDDYHNLALANNNDVNEKRSNYPLGNVVSGANNIWFESKRGRDANNNIVYEVRDEFKGDVARAIFYMSVAYNGKSGSWAFNDLPSLGPNQNIDLLKEWHFQDLPDKLEIAKHEFIYDLQNNRNPFIDFPELVDCINFRTLTHSGECPIDSFLSINRNFSIENVKIYPNPSNQNVTIEIDENAKIISVEIVNSIGQKVHEVSKPMINNILIDTSKLKNGVYFVNIYTTEGLHVEKIIIEK